MAFLVDNNLSPRLAELLAEDFIGTRHVFELEMDTAQDNAIWQHAKNYGLTILTKDNDFEAMSRLFGCPPKVVQLTCGNKKTGEVLSILRKNLSAIQEFLTDREDCLLVIN